MVLILNHFMVVFVKTALLSRVIFQINIVIDSREMYW